MFDDKEQPRIYHYEIYYGRLERVTHIDIRNLKAYCQLSPSIFDLISINKKEVITQIIELAIKNNEIDFSKEHQ
jgi:hypothetical protein